MVVVKIYNIRALQGQFLKIILISNNFLKILIKYNLVISVM